MIIIILSIGLLIGFFLNLAVNSISYDLCKIKTNSINFAIVFISGILFLMLFLRFGLNITFAKAAVMTGLLVIVSFVDLKHEAIPDKLWIISLIGGLVFALIEKQTLLGSLLGMLIGGGMLLLLAFIPHALGGGDIKIMFAVGSFLGPYKTLQAIFLAFALSSVIIIFLLLLKVKGRKDYIPFGPFLALGSFISFLI